MLHMKMTTYKNLAATISKRATKEFANFECFLSEEAAVFAMFSDYSELTNKNRKLMEKVCRKHLAACIDEFRRGIPVASSGVARGSAPGPVQEITAPK